MWREEEAGESLLEAESGDKETIWSEKATL